MVDSINSGYKAEIQSVAFNGTRKLNSLADTEWSHLSDEIDNSLNGYSFFDAWLELESAAWAGNIDIYVVPSIDGTNYPDWTGDGTGDLVEQNTYYEFSFTTSSSTAAQNLAERGMVLPPGKFKFGVRNQGGVATTAQNNILKWRPWNWGAR